MEHKRIEVTEVADWLPVRGATLPAVFVALLTEEAEGGPDLRLSFAVRGGVPECREVCLTASREGHEVRVSDLARVKVEDLMEAAITELRIVHGTGDRDPRTGLYEWYDREPGRAEIRAVREARAQRKVKMTDDLLREVAEVYRANVSDKPLEAVAQRFDKAHRTAALYVSKARERGYLKPALKGRAGELEEEHVK